MTNRFLALWKWPAAIVFITPFATFDVEHVLLAWSSANHALASWGFLVSLVAPALAMLVVAAWSIAIAWRQSASLSRRRRTVGIVGKLMLGCTLVVLIPAWNWVWFIGYQELAVAAYPGQYGFSVSSPVGSGTISGGVTGP
jgi:hypothetical protein